MGVGQKRLLHLFNWDFSLPVTNFDILMKNVHQLSYAMQKKKKNHSQMMNWSDLKGNVLCSFCLHGEI